MFEYFGDEFVEVWSGIFHSKTNGLNVKVNGKIVRFRLHCVNSKLVNEKERNAALRSLCVKLNGWLEKDKRGFQTNQYDARNLPISSRSTIYSYDQYKVYERFYNFNNKIFISAERMQNGNLLITTSTNEMKMDDAQELLRHIYDRFHSDETLGPINVYTPKSKLPSFYRSLALEDAFDDKDGTCIIKEEIIRQLERLTIQ